MTRTFAEITILSAVACGAGVVGFASSVLQRVMEELDPEAFKELVRHLLRRSPRDPFSVLISAGPFFGGVACFASYGFGHGWFTAGWFSWVAASTLSKLWNLPLYRLVVRTNATATSRLGELRVRLRRANAARAWLLGLAIVLMLFQFRW